MMVLNVIISANFLDECSNFCIKSQNDSLLVTFEENETIKKWNSGSKNNGVPSKIKKSY